MALAGWPDLKPSELASDLRRMLSGDLHPVIDDSTTLLPPDARKCCVFGRVTADVVDSGVLVEVAGVIEVHPSFV
jgi:hypothetical protein